jgi:hypothetical protein
MKQNNGCDHTITTKDLYFSACLKALGYQFLGAERNGDGRVYFTFKSDSENLENLKDEYYLNDISVGARTYSLAWKALRKVMDRV